MSSIKRPDTTPKERVPEFAFVFHNDPSYGDSFAMVYDWTWEVELDSVARTAYHYLLHRCGAKKEWPVRREEIAHICGVSVRRLTPHIKTLEEQGLITVENLQKECKPSIYRIRTKAEVAGTQSLLRRDLGTKRPQVRPRDKTSPPSRQNVPTLGTKRPDIKEVDTSPNTGIDREIPPTPHSRGDGEGGVAPLQFIAREEPPHFDGRTSERRWSTETMDTAAALASIIGLPADQDFMEAWAPHVDRARKEGVPSADIIGCLRWMWSDPDEHWQHNMHKLGVKAIRSQLVTWRGEGRPESRHVAPPPKKAAPSHQQPAAALSAPDAYSGGKFGLCQICGSRPCAPDCPQQEHPDPRAVGLPPFSTRGEGS